MSLTRQRLLTLLLILLAAAAWWLATVRERGTQVGARDPGVPDQVVEGLRATTMDEAGRPQRRLIAREARHYPRHAGTQLDEPHLTLFTETGPPWRLQSERGWVAEKAEEIRLQGQVLLEREAGADNPPLQVETRELLLRPQEDYARTDQPLHAISGPDWLHSVQGGEAWFGEALRARLFGRVSLEYAPPPPVVDPDGA